MRMYWKLLMCASDAIQVEIFIVWKVCSRNPCQPVPGRKMVTHAKSLYTSVHLLWSKTTRYVYNITKHFHFGCITRRHFLKLIITLHNCNTVHLNAGLGFQGNISTETCVTLQNLLVAMLLRTNIIFAS